MGKVSNVKPAVSLTFGSGVVQSPERGMALEWLESNDAGDAACGTVTGPATRRRHGLFAAVGATGPAMLLLAALDVAMERDGERFDLSTHQYGTALAPEGFRRCTQFSRDLCSEWRIEAGGAVLTRRLCLPRHARCMVNTWTLDVGSAPGPWRLRVRPLFAYRDAEALTVANPHCNLSLRQEGDVWAMAPYPGCPECFIHAPAAQVRPEPLWYYRFRHAHDAEMGRESDEDLFTPCEIVYDLVPGRSAALAVGVERPATDPLVHESQELARRTALTLPDMDKAPFAPWLARATEAFVAGAPASAARLRTCYPDAPAQDFRATLIALPGLMLHMRRIPEAKSCITAMMERLLDATAKAPPDDVPLWFMRASELYIDHSRDWPFLREQLAPACDLLAQRYMENKSGEGFRLEPDGLLCSGGTRPLTWMDGTIGDQPVTPRTGKPVEINALWHHCLGLLVRWASRRELTDQARHYASLQDLCGRAFRLRFWNASENCLFDVVDPAGASGSAAPAIRPNQLWAVALPTDLLDRHQAAGVLSVVENRLLTPCGLRTLSLEDRAFQPRCGATAAERAAACHQGAIYPWLLGIYVDAVFRVHGRTPRAHSKAELALTPLLQERLREGCIGQIAECFDATAPHSPSGALAHAPALAEVLRAYVEVKGRVW